jgi:methylmalonyl-CoA/ethylmalonyl-CoA epimerase
MSAAAEQFGLDQIGQIAVTVDDIARAVAFYRDTLGMRFLFQFGKLAFFDCSGVRLLVEVPEDPAFRRHSSVVYYKVADIQAAFETLSSRGVAFIDEPHIIARMPDHVLWMTFFRDPDENVLALMSEVRH